MRLTQIKLAGFKSFVDPTSISVPGDLVGVVGPNGCGKSNIIDAVRWVLGESRASALRGESMQDVIFNGSAQRKPVARASVELVFDNAMGKAAGQWSRFAEISVKRVLQRDGESHYFINNQVVRRRDIQDIFLGTGVGPRAYAIIEQGMISRVIEAKPEELRVFLEEAAGVSKYKERRRETEQRLEDTRENLARVDDIRRELDAQIEKLTRQAEVAAQYKSLQAEVHQKQNLLWLLRKNDAGAERERHAREIEKVTNELEAETARLREIELSVEKARTEHYHAQDAANSAQTGLYEANTEVSRLEAEIRFITETRQRLDAQAGALAAQLAEAERRGAELADARTMWTERKESTQARLAAANARVDVERAKLPDLETAYRTEQTRVTDARAAIALAEQAFQIEQTHLAHAGKLLAQLETREERLAAERQALAQPEPERLAEVAAQIEQFAAALAARSGALADLSAALPSREAARADALARLQALERDKSVLDGRLAALKQIQDRVEENGQIQDWLARHSLASLPRLWQKVTVEPGWESALESVLRERLHALELDDPDTLQRLLDDPPPAKVSVFSRGGAADTVAIAGHRPLADLVATHDPGLRPLIEDWLAGYYAADGVPRLMARLALPAGVVLVNAAGHQFRRLSVSFHAPDAADTGILARQREIEALAAESVGVADRVDAARLGLTEAEAALAEHRTSMARERDAEAALKQSSHEAELSHLRLTESQARAEERSAQIAAEVGEIRAEKERERARQGEVEANLERHQAEIDRLWAEFESVRTGHQAAEGALDEQRKAVAAAEREAQETGFLGREADNKINEIDRFIETAHEQQARAIAERERIDAELGELRDEPLRASLQEALALRVEREGVVGAARDRLEDLTNRLRGADEARLASEQRLQPLRDRIGEVRLKEQAARLNYEQYAQQLFEAGADEALLAQSLEKGLRAGALQSEIGRIQQAIAELGAVNLAALEELESSRERKDFLDSQSTDLAEALTTLENAIRRIDRETRERLQDTFDRANEHFGQLFPTLFGGGDAKLVMTGEEVLDAGVQVMAHPPGKKNTSIHLLSGGEKALTATALIFALFQLNPAPFCLLDEVDAPLDDTNTERFCNLVKKMSANTQFLFISHNKITMELAQQLIGVTMQESGVSRVVAVDIEEALQMRDRAVAA
ncbi:MAG: chromosome segregation protein SMC [Burkholderiales bacterium]|nr:chromosome segregation protein SMC [Burkholderiales bacterium]